ncbi:MAG: hypothetical protein ACP5DQ_01895 [Bacteroidales bacterium]
MAGKVIGYKSMSIKINTRITHKIPITLPQKKLDNYLDLLNSNVINKVTFQQINKNKNKNKIIPVYENEELSAQYQLSAKNELERKQYEEALKQVEQAIYKAPNNYKAYHTLACLLSAKGYSNEAFDIYRNAKRIKKSSKLKYYTKNNAKNQTFIPNR